MVGEVRQRLRKVPWRHAWILGLAVLLLVLALFGLFPSHRAPPSGHGRSGRTSRAQVEISPMNIAKEAIFRERRS